MSDQNFVTALGTTLWNTGLNFGDTVWTGVSEVADATGGFISEEYNAFTDTAYEIVTAPVRAAETVTEQLQAGQRMQRVRQGMQAENC